MDRGVTYAGESRYSPQVVSEMTTVRDLKRIVCRKLKANNTM